MLLLHKALCFCSERRFPGKQARQGTPNRSLRAYRCQAPADLCTTKITSNPRGWATEHLQQQKLPGFAQQPVPASEMSIQPNSQPLATLTCVFLHLFWRLVDDFHLLLKQAFTAEGKVFCCNNPEWTKPKQICVFSRSPTRDCSYRQLRLQRRTLTHNWKNTFPQQKAATGRRDWGHTETFLQGYPGKNAQALSATWQSQRCALDTWRWLWFWGHMRIFTVRNHENPSAS